MTEQEVREILEKCKVILSGHFVLTSGRHADTYVNIKGLFPRTKEPNPYIKEAQMLCREIALRTQHFNIEVVVGPETGGTIMSQYIADYLTEFLGREVLAALTEKIPGTKEFVFKDGHDERVTHKRVLVVEDVLTSGTSVRNVVNLARVKGGFVVALGAICNRGNVTTKEVGDVAKFFALSNLNLQVWDESECPHCRDDTPINTEVGKGAEYLSKRGK